MQSLRYRVLLLLWMVALPLFGGCSEDEDVLKKQEDQIVSFLKSKLGLRSEQEAFGGETEVQNPKFYSTFGGTVYRYITNYYDVDRRERPEVFTGSLVDLTVSIYLFENSVITNKTIPLYSNDPTKIELLEDAGLSLDYWTFEPWQLRAGEGKTIKGLDISLAGCRESDIVELYMSYPMAFGGDWFYTIPPDSPVAIFFTIDKVYEE